MWMPRFRNINCSSFGVTWPSWSRSSKSNAVRRSESKQKSNQIVLNVCIQKQTQVQRKMRAAKNILRLLYFGDDLGNQIISEFVIYFLVSQTEFPLNYDFIFSQNIDDILQMIRALWLVYFDCVAKLVACLNRHKGTFSLFWSQRECYFIISL